MKNKKICAVIAVAMFFNITIFATPYFSGYAGVGSRLKAEETSNNPELLLDGFFSGQFDLSPLFMLRLGCSIYTEESIFGQPLFEHKASIFSLNELSLTYRSFLGKVTQYIGIYAGEYDPVGSDIFLQRQFGIDPFCSRLSETMCGLTPSTIFNNSGIGAAYTINIPGNVAIGAYIYYNTLLSSSATPSTEESLNADFRIAGAWPLVALDFVLGVTMPMTTSLSAAGSNSVTIERGDLHLGFTAFFGSSNTSSFLFQAGIRKLVLDKAALASEAPISLEDVYILVEPNFITKNICFSLTLYNMPAASIEELYYIKNPTGGCLNIYSPWVVVNGNRCLFGLMTDVSCVKTLDQIILDKSTFTENLALTITPYGEVKFGSGKMHYSLGIDCLSINDGESFLHSMTAIIGYKTQF